jgi:primosomal protein N' (replication factor Y) (superfamily II helicase)
MRGIFSWHVSIINNEELRVNNGGRVVVLFRGRKRVGIVVGVSKKEPEFKTQPIVEVWDENFISASYIEIAREVAEENFALFEKVLSLMVPEKFFNTRHPEKRETFYNLSSNSSSNSVKGAKQKLAIELLQKAKGRMSSEALREEVSLATLQGLVKKEILTLEEGTLISPLAVTDNGKANIVLNEDQEKALKKIKSSQKPTLLFGVTGSGKTEIYKKLAQEVSPDGQVLLLLPEIALTPQLIAEFQSIFKGAVAIWHSKLAEGEKIQEWARVQSGEAKILIGARSAVFVPLRKPELVILDEEHEWTFKNEFAPRFHTIDVAQKIEQKMCSRLVLGSATPRLESFQKCEVGEWNRVDLPRRVGDVLMPEMRFVDLVSEGKRGNYGPLSGALEEELKDILKQKKQAVFFLNKRGFSGSTMCKSCGHKFECPNCSHNMKMHRKRNDELRMTNDEMRAKFVCHVCGHLELFPKKCPECQTEDFAFKGWGTQMVEDILKEKFPELRVFRADADSITGKKDFETLMNKFHNYEADVLLGTQMIAKGLDFERVQLVGVILADVGLNLPDFRSEERVFQILTQVSGRAGRREQRGKIVIQTFNPEEKIFDFVKTHDAESFLHWQKEMRKKALMPPFSAIAKLTISDVRKEVSFKKAKEVQEILRLALEKLELAQDDSRLRSCHFAPAFFPRTHGKYHFHVFLKAPNKKELVSFLKQQTLPDGVKIDIDPSSLL